MNDQKRTGDQSSEEPADEAPKAPATEPTEVIDGARPKRLLRSGDDRMIAGVAGGLGRYFQVDPVIFRIGFAVSVFFGGLGILAYLALWLFVPADPRPGEDPEPAPAQRSRLLGLAVIAVGVIVALSAAGSLLFWGDWGWGGDGLWGLLICAAIIVGAYAVLRDREPGEPMTTGRKVAVIALVILGVIGLFVLAGISAYTAATGSGTAIALVVIGIGVMLALAAFRGGARWLIAPALAIAIPLGAVSAADISFAGGIGDRYHQPATRAALEDRYELGVGRLVVDLRELDWSRDADDVDLDVDLGIGEAAVIVPESVCVSPDLHVGAGEIELGSGRTDGVDLDEVSTVTPASGPALRLEGEVDLGAMRVLNAYDEHDGPPFGRFDERGSGDRATVC
jgi:phage shock protein PspC (stress-responsive transcriptional regulator)